MGWNSNDILFFSSIDIEYQGVRSLPLSDHKRGRKRDDWKIEGMIRSIGMCPPQSRLWFDDLDAFQVAEMHWPEQMEGKHLGAVLYRHRRTRRKNLPPDLVNSGSIFYASEALDLLHQWIDLSLELSINQERSLYRIFQDAALAKRLRELNPTFNIERGDFNYLLMHATRPVRVEHFHPFSKEYKQFALGMNATSERVTTSMLNDIMERHGVNDVVG